MSKSLASARRRAALFLAAFLATVGGWSACERQRNRSQTVDYVQDLGLHAAQPPHLLPTAKEIWQPFHAPRYPLRGLRLMLARPVAQPLPTDIVVGVITLQGKPLFETRSTVQLGAAPRLVEVRFPHLVDAPEGIYFHVLSEVAVNLGLSVERHDGPQGHSVIFQPIYEAPHLMHLRLMLAHQAQVVCVLALGLILLGWRLSPFGALWAAFTVMVAYHCLARVPFWVLDEGSHLGCIVHMVKTGTLPLTTMLLERDVPDQLRQAIGHMDFPYFGGHPIYEAVQGPLYYLILAAVAKLSLLLNPSWPVAFYVMRAAGALILSAGCYALLWTVRLLHDRRVLDLDLRVLAVAVGCILFSPGVLSSLGGISNDQLTFALGSLCFSQLLRVSLSGRVRARDAWILGLCSGALWLTKLTGIFMPVLIGVCLLASRRFKLCALYLGVVAACVLPLHIFWYAHYQAFSGMAHHVAFIGHIVNPDGTPLLWSTVFSRAWRFYFLGALRCETPFIGPFVASTCHHLGLWSVTGLLGALGAAACRLRQGLGAAVGLHAGRASLEAVVAMGLLGPVLLGSLISMQVGYVLVGARYGYVSLFCSCMASALAYQACLSAPQRRWVAGAAALAMAWSTCQYTLASGPLQAY